MSSHSRDTDSGGDGGGNNSPPISSLSSLAGGGGALYNVSSSSAIAPVDRSTTPLNLDLNDLFGDDELAALTGAYGSNGNGSGSGENEPKKRTAAPTLTVSRRKKKPKGFPKRPLSGYNIFFKQERVSVLEAHSTEILAVANHEDGMEGDNSERTNVSFQDLGKIIGKRWKALSEEERKKYEHLAQHDSLRYRNEMEAFNESKRKYNEEKIHEATTGYRDEKDYNHAPSRWNSSVIAGIPDIKPLFPQSAVPQQPLQARLPGLKDPPQSPQKQSQQQQHQQDLYSNPSTSYQPSQPQPSEWRPSLHRQHSSQHQGYEADSAASNAAADAAANAASSAGINYSIPPGTELYLPDPQGRERKFKVQYKFYTMSRQAAETYMEHLSTAAVSTPYGFTDYPPPPPPQPPSAPPNGNSRDARYPYWS